MHTNGCSGKWIQTEKPPPLVRLNRSMFGKLRAPRFACACIHLCSCCGHRSHSVCLYHSGKPAASDQRAAASG